jgi:hypothetical protein
MEDIIEDMDLLFVDEELKEPFKTLYEILDEIDCYDNVTANKFHEAFNTIIWDTESFETAGHMFIPTEQKEKYETIKAYIQDAKTVSFDSIFNCQSNAFGPYIAAILSKRIKEMSDILEFPEKISAIQKFKDRVLNMIADEELTGEDASEVCTIVCQLSRNSSEF